MSERKWRDASTPNYFASEEVGAAEINERMFEMVRFDNEALPSLDKWEAGEEYYLEVKVKLEEKNIKQGKTMGEFSIVAIKEGKQEEEEMTPDQKRIKRLIG